MARLAWRNLLESNDMYWFGVLFATIGAGAILFALTFISAVIGGLVNAMIVLMAGPWIDTLLVRFGRSQTAGS